MVDPVQITASRQEIVRRMFLETADENYIAARWCHDNALWTTFLWNAAHCLKKYMKAALLMNSRSVARYSHDLAQIYDELSGVAGSLLPGVLQRPSGLHGGLRQRIRPRKFLAALETDGGPDNRYLTHGFEKDFQTLHVLDRLVWLVRRLSVPLDAPVANAENAPTFAVVLEQDRSYAPDQMLLLERVIRGPDGPSRRGLLNHNLEFAPNGYRHEERPWVAASTESPLWEHIFGRLGSQERETAYLGYQVAIWFRDNTKHRLKAELKSAMREALARHPGIDGAPL